MKAFIITRDRVEYARRTAEAFDAAGLDTVLVDHGSTYEPMVDWLKTRDNVHYRGSGFHPRSLWAWEPFLKTATRERFILSDPDTPPAQGCPSDWVDRLSDVLDRYPMHGNKVGMGLRIDNLPDHYQRKEQVLSWEGQYWQRKVGSGIWLAGVDTTIQLHGPIFRGSEFFCDGIRTDFPYVAEHLAWHEDFDNLAPDVRYYHEHAERGISEWSLPGKSARYYD